MPSKWIDTRPTTSDLSEIEDQIDEAIQYLTRFIRYQNSPSYTEAGADLRDDTMFAVQKAVNNFEHYWKSNNLDRMDSCQRSNLQLITVAQKYNKMHDLIDITNRR